MQSHWDGPEYTIGVTRYSLQNDTPSVPGYPLYIALGKLFHIFFSDAHLSILLVSVLFSGIGTTVFYALGKNLFNKTVGLIAAILFLSGPTFYYFGITANPYGILPTTAVLLVWIVYEITERARKNGIFLGIVFALSIGVRPQDAFFLTPLFIYGLIRSDTKNRIVAIITCILGLLCWLIPLLQSAGGLNEYIYLLKKYSEEALPSFSLLHLYSVWFILAKGLFLSFGLSIIFLSFYFKFIISPHRIKLQRLLKNKYFLLFFLWIAPSLLFNMFIRSDHAAHQMTYLSGILMLIAYAIWECFQKNKSLLWFTLSALVLFNLFTFFRDRDPGMKKPYIPQSYHYSEIRKNDLRLKSKVTFIQQTFNPKTTYIISTEPFWCQYSYYLKSYQITALFGLNNINAPYKYLHDLIYAKNWNITWSQTKDFTIIIPKNISTIVFMDDETSTWIKNHAFKTFNLAGNSQLTIISISKRTKIKYDYHYLAIY